MGKAFLVLELVMGMASSGAVGRVSLGLSLIRSMWMSRRRSRWGDRLWQERALITSRPLHGCE